MTHHLWHIPRLLRSPNATRWAHWRVAQREARAWHLAVRATCGRRDPPHRGPARVHVHHVRARLLDLGSATAAVKPLLDALRRNGWIEDDRPVLLELEVTQGQAPKREAHRRGVVVELDLAPAGRGGAA